MDETTNLWPRNTLIRLRYNFPTSCLEVTIHEAKNRQVWRVAAAVGLPTFRLIGYRIGDWSLDELGRGNGGRFSVLTASAHAGLR
jgi:23S rRNA pseudouridine2457 synthase